MKKQSLAVYVLVFSLVFLSGFGMGGALESYRSEERFEKMRNQIMIMEIMRLKRNEAIKKYHSVMQKAIEQIKQKDEELKKLKEDNYT